MKQVKVVTPTSGKSSKMVKVKDGRVKKKDKSKMKVGGPGSTPFHAVESSKLKQALANEVANNFSLSKKKLNKVKSPNHQLGGTPTTDGGKKSAKKVIIPTEIESTTPKNSSRKMKRANVQPEDANSKLSPKQKMAKKAKGANSETKINGSEKVTTSSLLLPANVANAIKALRKHIEEYKSKQSKIVDESTPLILTVDYFKLPKPTQIHSRALLPHSVVTDLHDVCFFVRDPKKRKNEADDDESWEDEVKEVLKKHGVNNVTEVWPWRKFVKSNTQFEEKKKFADRFDFILADSVIAYRWMGILNQSIFKNKFPIPVRYSPTSSKLKKEFDNALRKIQVKISGKGLSSACIFGHDGLTDSQLADNLNALCLFLSDKARYPGGAGNIRSLHIKTARSESFPIYISIASPNSVEVPTVSPKRKSKPVVGELPTLYHNEQVKVYPDGRIYEVKRLKAIKQVENNSSPIKRVNSNIKPKETSEDSSDDDMADDFPSQSLHHDSSDDANEDSSEEEAKFEEVEREYLEELREMQDKAKKTTKASKTGKTKPSAKVKSLAKQPEGPKKKSSPTVGARAKTPASGSVKSKGSPGANVKKSKNSLKSGKKST